MTNQYFDFDSEKVISLRLQDYEQYPDTSAGKVRQTPSNKSKYRPVSDDYTRSNNSRKNKSNNPERVEKSRGR
jgi:hypothetical protein